jgi:serine/threonine protein kinase
MKPYSLDSGFQVLFEDGERVLRRGWRMDDDGHRSAVLVVLPAAEHPSPSSLDRLAHEYGLTDELDKAWAAQPLDLVRDGGRAMLVLKDPGGEPLDLLLGAPMEVGHFLRLATRIATALGKLHQRRLVHKDIKPANILVNSATGEVWLTGFGIASRLSRERQAIEPPEALTGTLAYMAPEQTGRMNRSLDSRSDLYALGVTFYQMLTGALPFAAADPMELVHCHLARWPVPPADRVKVIPSAVSAIIMRLLAKTAEERYQTAAGLENDLRSCLTRWEARRRIDDFPLGQHDTPDRLLIQETLWATTRGRDLTRLLQSRRQRRRPRTRPGLRLFRHRQVFGRKRAAQSARAAARPFRFRQVRSVQTRYSLLDAGTGLSEPDQAAAGQKRSGPCALARRVARDAGTERRIDRGSRS